MKHTTHLQKIIRAGLAGGDMVKPLAELKLAVEAEFEESRAAASREFALWLGRQIQHAKGERRVDGPTAETEAKARLSIDPVEALRQRGKLGDVEIEGIYRLRRCWGALSAGLDTHAAQMDGVIVDCSVKPMRDPADRLPDWLWLEVKHVFMPWVEAHEGKIVLGDRRIEMISHNLVWLVAVGGSSIRRLERQVHVGNGRLVEPFVEAVRDYMRGVHDAKRAGKLKMEDEDG